MLFLLVLAAAGLLFPAMAVVTSGAAVAMLAARNAELREAKEKLAAELAQTDVVAVLAKRPAMRNKADNTVLENIDAEKKRVHNMEVAVLQLQRETEISSQASAASTTLAAPRTNWVKPSTNKIDKGNRDQFNRVEATHDIFQNVLAISESAVTVEEKAAVVASMRDLALQGVQVCKEQGTLIRVAHQHPEGWALASCLDGPSFGEGLDKATLDNIALAEKRLAQEKKSALPQKAAKPRSAGGGYKQRRFSPYPPVNPPFEAPGPRGPMVRNPLNQRPVGSCFQCGQMGHVKANCPNRP
jgi:hypothetical protein